MGDDKYKNLNNLVIVADFVSQNKIWLKRPAFSSNHIKLEYFSKNMNKQDKFAKLCEQTRQGKNICKICGNPKQIYYQPWCPRCGKPQIEKLETINLIQVLEHLEAIGNKGFKDKIWRRWCDNGIIQGNDSYSQVYFPTKGRKQGIEDYGEEHYNDLMLIKETFELGESVLFNISW